MRTLWLGPGWADAGGGVDEGVLSAEAGMGCRCRGLPGTNIPVGRRTHQAWPWSLLCVCGSMCAQSGKSCRDCVRSVPAGTGPRGVPLLGRLQMPP